MNPPPTVGLKTLTIFGLSFVKQLAHGLVKRIAGYVTLLNAFVLVFRGAGIPLDHAVAFESAMTSVSLMSEEAALRLEAFSEKKK